MCTFRSLRTMILTVFAVAAIGLTTDQALAAGGVSMTFVGRAAGGGMNANGGASEISAYAPASQRLFVINNMTNKIDIWNLAKPTAPTLITSVTLPSATGVQSVATNGTLVAAAATVGDGTDDKIEPGRIFIFNTSGTLDTRAPNGVEVGMLPDSVHFSPDGKTIVVANEGEPKNYCLDGNGDFMAANDPNGTVSIIDATAATLSATTIDFSAFNASAAGIRTAGGRVYGPGATVAQDLEPEYVAISPDSKTAFVTLQENNAVAEVNLATKTVTRIMGLGYKDHSVAGSGLDPSDREVSSSQGSIAIGTWPVFGMYQPDNIATFTGGDGAQYFMTANEGDSREYPCLLGGTSTSTLEAEDGRIGANGIGGQSGADGLLGRLTVTRFAPSVSTATLTYGGQTFASGTPAYTSAYSLGARSMTIWKVPAGAGIGSAVKVADTGDLIEQKTSVLYPTYFNNDGKSSNGGFSAFDSRSDNKGPEPEGIATGRAFGMQLAFVGLERQNGVMAFDVSDPASPRFLDYLNTANYSGTSGANYATSTGAGDVSPEGVLFVSASDSPTGKPALMVSNELSGTTTIFNLNGTALVPGVPTGVTAVAKARTVTVSWSRPSEDGGGAITEYHVTAKPGGYTCTADATTSCKLEQMPAGREYTFTVKALNIAGSSAASAASAAVKTATFKPAAPSAIKLRAGSSSLRVEWRRSNDNGGAKITKYVATAKPGGATCTSTGRSCIIEGLTAGQKYSAKVVTVNAVGTSTEVGSDRVLVGVVQGAKTIAQRSPLAVSWLVRSHSTGKVKGSIVSGDCSIADGRITATGAVGSTCQVKVMVSRAPGFAPMTRTLDLEVRAPRDYKEIFARRR